MNPQIVPGAQAAMSSAPPVELFKGKDWEECDNFIRAIRARALWEGKQRDLTWMADFAAPQFSQKALSWHCRLPEDVQQDWSKLVIALLDRWPFPEDDDNPQIKPTPAAALSLNTNGSVGHPLQGALKVVLNESDKNYYVRARASDSICTLTTDASEAIRVRCSFVSDVTLLERIDDSCHSWLATHWLSSEAKIERGSTEYAFMAWVNSNTLKSSYGSHTPFQLIRCTVSSNGEVVPVWTKDDASKITIFPFVSSNWLYLATDPEAFVQRNSSMKRGRFFVQPTN